MSEEQHTPGPWRAGHLVDEEHSCNCPYIFGNDDRMGSVAHVRIEEVDAEGCSNDCPPLAEAKANMRLIAAAPDLLEACKAIADPHNWGDGNIPVGWRWADLRQKLEAAIAQATSPERRG